MEKILVTRSSMPSFEEFIKKIKPLWDSKWLTNMGVYHAELEQNLKEYLGVPYLSLMVNGHMALEMTLQAMNFPEGSEVITTPFTFVSTTHAIVRNRLEPVFCDIKLDNYTIDENKIYDLITEKTVAILPVHVYGNICNVEKIQKIANECHLKVIYDACHAFGETYKGQYIGNMGDASVFSFHATKVYNTIEGGAVTFHNKNLYDVLYNLKNFGIRGEEQIVQVGANAKMNEFAAAMGLCNLPLVERNISLRRERAEVYQSLLFDAEGVELPSFNDPNLTYNYGYYPVLFKPEVFGNGMRDIIYNTLKEYNIYSRKYFFPLTSDGTCFGNKYKNLDLKFAHYAADNILVLPLYPELPREKIVEICDIIKKTLNCK